jgi:hypothetical protein
MKFLNSEFHKLWEESKPLTLTTILMMGALVLFSLGLLVDDRMITGAPAWLKPAKFAISTTLFSATMAWLFRYLTVWRRFARAMGWVISLVFVVEVAIIGIQAGRGTTSHFNVATPLDAALWGIMGSSIFVLWLASVGILVALMRQTFANPEWGRWLRMGMLVSVLGSAMGGLMVRPTTAQIEEMRRSEKRTVIGAHTVGAPDGEPGLPGVGWSTRHGDLRIPHFMGLHGVQILPLLGWLFMRRGSSRRTTAYAAGASYIALIAILTWQALRGQSLVDPDSTTLIALALWLAGTVAAFLPSLSHRHHMLATSR